MREIYTYANPLKMNKDKTIWEMVNKYPQFCASDTLHQGMIEYYGRNEFTIIRSINDLKKALVGEVTDDVRLDVQLFLDVSHEIRSIIQNNELRTSFQNNIGEVVTSIRYLLYLEATPESLFKIESVNEEQGELFRIYNAVYPKYKTKIEQAINKRSEEVKQAIKETILFEAEFLIRNHTEEDGRKKNKWKTLQEAKNSLIEYKNDILDKIEKRGPGDYSNTSVDKAKLPRVEYVIDLINRIDSINTDAVIIHGVHRFTPEILLMIRAIENAGINIVFLIHYVEKLPQVYGTWREVYSWMNEDFKNVKDFNINDGSSTGREIAKVFLGRLSDKSLNSSKIAYENISSFAVGEVRPVFQNAACRLEKMRTQYYAVSNEETNRILKNYFPEQFEVKPFLSYPIGQFILSIYNMWDFESSQMRITPASLRECTVSGMFENEVGGDISEIYEDIIPYIEGLEKVEEIIERLAHLKTEVAFINRNPGLSDLKSICYFSRGIKDIDRFIKYIKLLNGISEKIFNHNDDQVNYGQHFKAMMEILSVPLSNAAIVHRMEVQLAEGVLESLGLNDNVVGDYYDIKNALMFYLHQKNNDDTSNWIVRNFEQLDGAVLLADRTKAREYHFALLSMKNMTRKMNDDLPWPLSEGIFNDYDCKLESSINASALSNRERANFLKYSLFYGVFFFRKRIAFSYVLDQNNEKQRAYYILDLLNLREKTEYDNSDIHLENQTNRASNKRFDYDGLTTAQREIFAICKYKFFLSRVLDESITYQNEFQIRYYLTNLITQVILEDKKLAQLSVDNRINQYIKMFISMFPNYDSVIFEDIKSTVKRDVINRLEYCKQHHINNYRQDEKYKRRKKNFLIAKWDESMRFENESAQDVINYMANDEILLEFDNRPHIKVCENCNFYADCLMKYYDESRLKENEV